MTPNEPGGRGGWTGTAWVNSGTATTTLSDDGESYWNAPGTYSEVSSTTVGSNSLVANITGSTSDSLSLGWDTDGSWSESLGTDGNWTVSTGGDISYSTDQASFTSYSGHGTQNQHSGAMTDSGPVTQTATASASSDYDLDVTWDGAHWETNGTSESYDSNQGLNTASATGNFITSQTVGTVTANVTDQLTLSNSMSSSGSDSLTQSYDGNSWSTTDGNGSDTASNTASFSLSGVGTASDGSTITHQLISNSQHYVSVSDSWQPDDSDDSDEPTGSWVYSGTGTDSGNSQTTLANYTTQAFSGATFSDGVLGSSMLSGNSTVGITFNTNANWSGADSLSPAGTWAITAGNDTGIGTTLSGWTYSGTGPVSASGFSGTVKAEGHNQTLTVKTAVASWNPGKNGQAAGWQLSGKKTSTTLNGGDYTGIWSSTSNSIDTQADQTIGHTTTQTYGQSWENDISAVATLNNQGQWVTGTQIYSYEQSTLSLNEQVDTTKGFAPGPEDPFFDGATGSTRNDQINETTSSFSFNWSGSPTQVTNTSGSGFAESISSWTNNNSITGTGDDQEEPDYNDIDQTESAGTLTDIKSNWAVSTNPAEPDEFTLVSTTDKDNGYDIVHNIDQETFFTTDGDSIQLENIDTANGTYTFSNARTFTPVTGGGSSITGSASASLSSTYIGDELGYDSNGEVTTDFGSSAQYTGSDSLTYTPSNQNPTLNWQGEQTDAFNDNYNGTVNDSTSTYSPGPEDVGLGTWGEENWGLPGNNTIPAQGNPPSVAKPVTAPPVNLPAGLAAEILSLTNPSVAEDDLLHLAPIINFQVKVWKFGVNVINGIGDTLALPYAAYQNLSALSQYSSVQQKIIEEQEEELASGKRTRVDPDQLNFELHGDLIQHAAPVINNGVQIVLLSQQPGVANIGEEAPLAADAGAVKADAESQSLAECNGGGCFLAGTRVVLGMEIGQTLHSDDQNGGVGVILRVRAKYLTKAIETLRPDDFVLARSEHDPLSPPSLRRVEAIFERIAHQLTYVTIRSSSGDLQTIITTNEHPFYMPGRGWVQSRSLEIGDELLEPTGGLSRVVSVRYERHPTGVTVYNFRVAQEHTYFVKAEGADAEPIWVHNAYQVSPSELVKLENGDVSFRGKIIQAQEDLTHVTDDDLKYISESGAAPKTLDGEQITLHHLDQDPEGPLWELPRSLHVNNPELHPYGNSPGVGLTVAQRLEFAIWRTAYWKARALQELQIRGLL